MQKTSWKSSCLSSPSFRQGSYGLCGENSRQLCGADYIFTDVICISWPFFNCLRVILYKVHNHGIHTVQTNKICFQLMILTIKQKTELNFLFDVFFLSLLSTVYYQQIWSPWYKLQVLWPSYSVHAFVQHPAQWAWVWSLFGTVYLWILFVVLLSLEFINI